MPEFPGGDEALIKFLSKNIRYPYIAQENGIKGRVYIQFEINKKGEIADIKIIKGIHQSLDEEALRVVNKIPK